MLAHDGMEGRSAFSPAALRAAEFIASEFDSIGLDEVSGNDGYLQHFKARRRGRGRRGGGQTDTEQTEYGLSNVVGMIAGNRTDEYVVFSAHYDHIGIRPGGDDVIANGANDNASGTTAVIELARYFNSQSKPERTLLFVAFTAEESGGLGSRYFSEQLDPDNIVAMFNIEMIGKPAVSGPNTAWITGFERSSFGEILQRAVEDTQYEFYADPYPEQNLFFRSDNATLGTAWRPSPFNFDYPNRCRSRLSPGYGSCRHVGSRPHDGNDPRYRNGGGADHLGDRNTNTGGPEFSSPQIVFCRQGR